jgi:hypothetical protein
MTSRRPATDRFSLRRPCGPRCHGGASSLLRLGLPALPQRAVTARASGWRELDDELASVEHIVGLPARSSAVVVSS